MPIRTVRKCRWDEIKVGEVFAREFTDSWQISIKLSIKKWSRYILLGTSGDCILAIMGNEYDWVIENFHKLPLSFQKNFIDWGKL